MPFNIPLSGRIEPRAASWKSATKADRRAFYLRAGEVAVRVHRAQLSRAIGVTGAKMPSRKYPRRDHANGPVLSPHHAESRTMRLMDFKAWENGVTIFWHGGGGQKHRKPWSTILIYHAEGRVRGAPVRDVRMSDASVKAVRLEMTAWWETRLRRKPVPPSAAVRSGSTLPTITPLAARALAFRPDPAANGKNLVTVRVSIAALDAGWQGDTGRYLPPGGGEDRGRYARVVAFLRRAMAKGLSVDQPMLRVGADGVVRFDDGRHRFAALRDMGAKYLPVSVPRAEANRVKSLFGTPKLAGKAKPKPKVVEAPKPKPVHGPPLKPLTVAGLSMPKPEPEPAPKPKRKGIVGRIAGKVVGTVKGWLGKLFGG